MIEELRTVSIVAAASGGDMQAVRCLVETGTNIETRDGDGDTPFLAASKRGHLDVMRYLIGRGADSHATNTDGQTALMVAAYSGNLDAADLILANGVKINVGDKEGKTALMYAAAKGGAAMTRFLIDRGALVEWQDKNSYNVLFYAAHFGQVDTTKYLIDNYRDKILGVDLDKLISAALDLSPSRSVPPENAEACISVILQAIGPFATALMVRISDERSVPLLAWLIATKKYSNELIKIVVSAGADPNAPLGSDLGPALHAAVIANHPEAVEALIENGAAVNAQYTSLSHHFPSPLVLAGTLKREACIAPLLKHGADISVLSDENIKALIAMSDDSQSFCEHLGVMWPAFPLTTLYARHMHKLAVFHALRLGDAQILGYFANEHPNDVGRRRQPDAYLSELRTMLTEAPATATKYAELIREIVVAAHVGTAKRIEDEKRGLRRSINELAQTIAKNFDWYEDGEEARGIAEYLLSSIDYKDAVRAGRDAETGGPPQTTSDIGMLFETKCQEILSEAGFAVTRTRQTGDQGADLIAKKSSLTYTVQCKAWTGAVGNSAVQEAISARSFYAADFAAVVSDGRFTAAARELAARSQIVLIKADGLKLLDAICSALA
jgi:ankyrin repeat protein